MRAFHFLQARYALEALQHRRLKVALLNELNDPFELFAADLSDRNTRFAFRQWKNNFAQRTGMLCFSKGRKNPLLWSHYADRHRGIALEFDIDDNVAVPVRYRRTRLRIDVDAVVKHGGFDEDLAEELYATKSAHWDYEEEVRVPTLLSECVRKGDLYFEPFGDSLEVVSVVLGSLCSVEADDIQRILPRGCSATVVRTRMAFRSFSIVQNKEYPVKRLRGSR